MYHCGLLLLLLDLSFDAVSSISQAEINRHLELGKEFLKKGHLQDALSHYHEAVDGDPQNYLTYYKRSTVYLALGKAKLALQDFDKILELKPGFKAARIQRGNTLLKLGEFDDAYDEYMNVLADDPHNTDVQEHLPNLDVAKQTLSKAKYSMSRGDYEAAISYLTMVIEISPWSSNVRSLRADCYVALNDNQSAISDIRSITKLLSDNMDGFYKLSTFLYQLGHVEESLQEIRNCLKLDPEHKACFPFYKKVKKVNKYLTDAETYEKENNYADCITSANRLLSTEPELKEVRFLGHHLLCKCYIGESDADKAIKSCGEALKIRKEINVLCDSAEAYHLAEMYDDAIRDYKEALQIDPHNERAKQGLQKVQQRQKLAETRDYYKILGVSRTASKREIIKAYRKAAQKWHPDNFQEGDEKKRAEKKFIDIAAAKEVLTDEQKRAKFDQGEDPLDPESGKHQGFNPFQEFHHFHGSPFRFKFNFN